MSKNWVETRLRLDGYQTEYVVDKEQYFVKLPDELEGIGVLSEPLSVVEKAIDEALRLQFVRLPDSATTPDWLNNRQCLVAGLGPIGLLAAMALQLRGARVYCWVKAFRSNKKTTN